MPYHVDTVPEPLDAPALQAQTVEDAMSQGMTLYALGDPVAALRQFARVLEQAPTHARALHMMGVLGIDGFRLDAALAFLQSALASEPASAEIWNSYACALDLSDDLPRALDAFDRCLALAPGMTQAWVNRGNALLAARRYEEALASMRRARGLDPGDSILLMAEGNALACLGRADEALAVFDEAIERTPYDQGLYEARAEALTVLERFDEALAWYDRASEVAPSDKVPLYKKSLLALYLGDYRNGWRWYEARWKARGKHLLRREFRKPLWLGDFSLEGKTVLLHNDQGLGDGIQLSRFATLVAAQGARVVLEVQKPLVPLLRHIEGVEACVPFGEPLPDFDVQCPLFSLPLANRIDARDIPFAQGYLRADPQRLAAWAERLGPRRAPRVGLAWSGNPVHSNDRHRTMRLAKFAAALPPGCEYVSLQAELRERDRDAASDMPWLRLFTGELKDFADTAALCAHMDLVVCVDTSVAHLAGALGQPTWLLLPDPGEYRWIRGRTDTPWYDSMRLWRQQRDETWEPVLARVRAALDAWCAGRA